MNKIKVGSNKSFGIVFFIFFLIIALYPLVNEESIRIWAVILSVLFLILGLINSQALTPLNILWFKFGILLGKIISPIVMGLVFFFGCNSYGYNNETVKKRFVEVKKK